MFLAANSRFAFYGVENAVLDEGYFDKVIDLGSFWNEVSYIAEKKPGEHPVNSNSAMDPNL